MFGLIILYIYLNLLWQKRFTSFIDRLSFSEIQSSSVLYPALDIGEKFSTVKYKAIAKFIWYIIFVAAFMIIKVPSINRFLMYAYGIIFATNEILPYRHLTSEIREIKYYGGEMTDDSLKTTKKAYFALLLYQFYLFIELLIFWY